MNTSNHAGIVADYVLSITDRIVAVLPPDKLPDIYVATVKEYLFRNPDLFQCERRSLDEAIVDAALLGLELGPPFDLATIIPYKPRDAQIAMANMVVEYRGHMVQVYRSGKVKTIEARAVYQSDKFEYQHGRRPMLMHQPTIDINRGPLVYAYAIAQLTDGGSATEVITRHDADRARADSPTANRPGSVWKTREAEMWIKTAIKKLAARLPRTLATAPGPGGLDPPKDYADLVKAVSVSPELYRQAISELKIDFPSDVISIRAVLSYMRKLYRTTAKELSKTAQDPPD